MAATDSRTASLEQLAEQAATIVRLEGYGDLAMDLIAATQAQRDEVEQELRDAGAWTVLKGHEQLDCPTWYDGCNCTVETLRHNIAQHTAWKKRAEAAEQQLVVQREQLEQAQVEIGAAREEMPIVRRQDFLDASLLTAVRETVSQMFRYQSRAEKAERQFLLLQARYEVLQGEFDAKGTPEGHQNQIDAMQAQLDAERQEVARLKAERDTALQMSLGERQRADAAAAALDAFCDGHEDLRSTTEAWMRRATFAEANLKNERRLWIEAQNIIRGLQDALAGHVKRIDHIGL